MMAVGYVRWTHFFHIDNAGPEIKIKIASPNSKPKQQLLLKFI